MSYSFACNWQNAFMTNPPHQCFGYLTDFNGLGLSTALAKDLTVYSPFNNAMTLAYTPIGVPVNNKVYVTAVLENFSWGGGTGDPLSFNCYISSQNTNQLRMLLQTTLKTTSISLGWWIVNYDVEGQQWFEMVYPEAPEKPSGQLNVQGSNISLKLANQPVQYAQGINLYNVSFEIIPSANHTAAILLATSPTAKVIKSWGLVVG